MLFTGTIASNIAYGNESATREQIEAAAREANCEFVWGMPQGFDTESECLMSCPNEHWFDNHLASSSWTFESQWWAAAALGYCACFVEEARYSCTRRGNELTGCNVGVPRKSGDFPAFESVLTMMPV